MATVSHAGFRCLVEDWGGCSLHFSEMIDAGIDSTMNYLLAQVRDPAMSLARLQLEQWQ